MDIEPGLVVLTAMPIALVVAFAVLIAAIARSLRDDAVLDALRAEVRSVGEVHRAVHEVRSSRGDRPAPR